MTTCKECIYWYRKDEKEDDGECRREPPKGFMIPQINPLSGAAELKIVCHFSRTHKEIWCGEGKEKAMVK